MRVKALVSFHKTTQSLWLDMVVNDYLEHVDRDAVTVANVNARFGLLFKRFRTIEYYARLLIMLWKKNRPLCAYR